MYKISSQVIDFVLFYKHLEIIEKNKQNKFPLIKLKPIGKSSCGFPIEHFKVGDGPLHIVYMGGTHGNEIISVDFILQLMNNLALGNGVFKNFNPDLFTVDFIPCQNPEGYFTTTYALKSVMKDMNQKEILHFCKQYYLNYRNRNVKINNLNQIICTCCQKYDFSTQEKNIITSFWKNFYNKKFSSKELIQFLTETLFVEENQIKNDIKYLWEENIQETYIDNTKIVYLEPFNNINLDCIPLIDNNHIELRNALEKLYQNNKFPFCTLANFIANASGVNLNDNNEFYFQELNKRIEKEKIVYSSPIYPLPKSCISPFGTTSIDFTKFIHAPENVAILKFFKDMENSCYAFFNCHGTGGQLYVEPFYDINDKSNFRDFSFYINNRIATEYLKEIEKTYIEKTGIKSSYEKMGYPNKITGMADLLRSKYIGHFLLELSKAGGNPLGPYIMPNYHLTMEANFRACQKIMDTILELEHLYDKTYQVKYNNNGKVNYYAQTRTRK